jgi:lipopolysaccharide/colanic/teichoic acid biosynthesis glycosyltransferase
MVDGADSLKEKLIIRNEMSGPVFKIKNDPRITSFGRFLRQTSIDELPQLFNVLKGEMSLVGPRPPIIEEAGKYEPWQRKRLSVKPGMTCIWQVSGRSNIRSFDEWVNMDIKYINNYSFLLDLSIIIKTIPAVISRRGAV